METEHHADQRWKKMMDLLSKTHRQGILESLVPELMVRLMDGRSDTVPLTITSCPLGKLTATFSIGKDTDNTNSITYAQAIESYMGTNRLDYDCKVMDYLFQAVGVPMEMMLCTHMHHNPDHHLELYNLLEVLARVEQEHNCYCAAVTSEQVTQDHIDKVPEPNRALMHGHSAPEPPTKLAVTVPQPCPLQQFEDHRGRQQHSQGWRQNLGCTQQLQGNFTLCSHQTAPADGDDAEPRSAPKEHYTKDMVLAEEVVNHQTKTPDAPYDDSEAWMEYNANAIKFEHEDDYLGH
ncbi:hypothetical protein H4R20_004267 [Coemansia guatemalensis]|uniref:Uncharacterized protein n=1 Tax=Coemansia guatemalensis TaxID=2761395 RepID=A0A9W8LRW5_9FUNG|nr:hypothetical protein H4R20_004267 [Coemansia guatemalensis]